MTEDERTAANELIVAIEKHRNWIGQTTRELRDQVSTAGKEINNLSKEMLAASERHKDIMTLLIAALNQNSKSSDRLSIWMILLTVILTIATAISAFSALYPLLSHK